MNLVTWQVYINHVQRMVTNWASKHELASFFGLGCPKDESSMTKFVTGNEPSVKACANLTMSIHIDSHRMILLMVHACPQLVLHAIGQSQHAKKLVTMIR